MSARGTSWTATTSVAAATTLPSETPPCPPQSACTTSATPPRRSGSRPGQSIYFVQQQLGHKDIQTTIDLYGHPDKPPIETPPSGRPDGGASPHRGVRSTASGTTTASLGRLHAGQPRNDGPGGRRRPSLTARTLAGL